MFTWASGASMATVSASGKKKVQTLTEELAVHPYLDKGHVLANARGVVVLITGGTSLLIRDIEEIMAGISQLLGRSAEISFGATTQTGWKDRVAVTLIASESLSRHRPRVLLRNVLVSACGFSSGAATTPTTRIPGPAASGGAASATDSGAAGAPLDAGAGAAAMECDDANACAEPAAAGGNAAPDGRDAVAPNAAHGRGVPRKAGLMAQGGADAAERYQRVGRERP